MEIGTLAIGILAGAVLAGLGVYLALRGRAEAQLREPLERLRAAESELANSNRELGEIKVHAAVLGERAEQAAAGLLKIDELERVREQLSGELAELKAREAAIESRYDEQVKNVAEQRILLEHAKLALADTFKALSADTLKGSREELKKDAELVLEPLREQLGKLDTANQGMEKSRASAYGEITKQLEELGQAQTGLRSETARLVKALQDPGHAGNWGEMVLEKVLEMSMLPKGILFETQVFATTEDGAQRPDVIVRMPAGRSLVIDAKAPMRQYLEALESEPGLTRDALLRDHAKKVGEHAKALNKRDYARRDDSVDFVVLFLPSESAFRAACEAQPSLIEDALTINVFIATPTTLIALLRSVAYGWRQETLAEEAKKVQREGQALYEAVCSLLDHYAKLGRSLQSACNSYRDFGGSLERNVTPKARRFRELGVASNKALPELPELEFTARAVQGSHADSPKMALTEQARLPDGD